jgi:hypothetical protein
MDSHSLPEFTRKTSGMEVIHVIAANSVRFLRIRQRNLDTPIKERAYSNTRTAILGTLLTVSGTFVDDNLLFCNELHKSIDVRRYSFEDPFVVVL